MHRHVKMKGIKQASEAKTIDLNITEDGIRPLSWRMKSAWYTGMLTMTRSRARISCRINCSNAFNRSISMAIFVIPPNKVKRFSIARVATLVDMIDELPNSMTSCSYLLETSSVTTLAVMTNVVSDSPNCLEMVSMRAKKYEVVLRINQILCEFHQASSVSPQLRASAMLQAFLARKTYAKGRNQRLVTCKLI
jgi:hypothetical protein